MSDNPSDNKPDSQPDNPSGNQPDHQPDHQPGNFPDDSHREDIGPSSDGGTAADRFAARRRVRIERVSHRRLARQPEWSLEMFESPLMDAGIAYTVNDAPSAQANASDRAWIDFTLPTVMYRDACGDPKVLVRLTVEGGRLSVTAPECYPRGSLVRTSDPPVDRDGTLRIARLGQDGELKIDLLMAADGLVTAAMQMDTIPRPFTRREIVPITDLFVTAIDLLEVIVRRYRLRISDREGSGDEPGT